MQSLEGEIRAGVYEQGYDKQSRTLAECEALWNRGPLMAGTFDALLSAQIDQAIAQERPTVNVLDLGSGTGALIKNVVNDPGTRGSKTYSSRQLLAGRPNAAVRIAGLTDALTPDEMFKRVEIVPNSSFTIPHPTARQITADNFHYSVTEDQRIAHFLRGIEMPKVDLIVSTWFFAHLPKGVFEKALLDATQALNPGGKMVIFGYHSRSRRVLDTLRSISDEDAKNDPARLAEAMFKAFSFLSGGSTGPDPDRDNKEIMIARLGDILQEDIRSSADGNLAIISRPL